MYFEEFKLGQIWQIPDCAISKEMIIEFAQIYDPLPIHLDEKYAKSTRFGNLIASGPQTFMLLWAQFIRTHDPLGDELVAGKRNRMSWPAPTYAGDVLHGEVEVISVEPSNAYNGVIIVEMRGYNQDGKQVVLGGADIYMKRRPQKA